MDHLRKVQSGQKLEIPAETFNSFIDAARDFKDRQRDKRSNPEPYFPDSGIILVANQSGEDRNQFDVLGVTEPIIRPEANLIEFKRRPTFRGVKPTEVHKCRFVVLLEPVKANKIAHAVIAGVTIVRLRIDDPLDTCCDIEPEKCDYLQTCIDGSAQILWKQKNSGTCWAIVRLGNCCEPDESSSSWSESSSLSESSSSPSDSSVSESPSDESLSEESSEVSESPSESESDECCGCRGVSGTVRVLLAEPYRSGDDLCFPMADLKFVDGCYQGMTPAGESCHYICCDESSSSSISDESSIGESSSSSSDESLSPSQSDLSAESSSPSQDSSLSDSPSESSLEDSSVSPSGSASESESSSVESSASQSSNDSSLDQSSSDPSWSDDSSLSDSDSDSSSSLWGGW